MVVMTRVLESELVTNQLISRKISRDDRIVLRISLPTNESAVANSASGTLSHMDTDGRILATYSAGGGPAKITFDGESLWVTNTADNTVSKITHP